jgi:NAD(P)-dependent dehydrogenase (short-subunit alcohol dehydrogenase family)
MLPPTTSPTTQRMQDKVVLVSGAGSSGDGFGIGKACAVLYARHGAKILAVDINFDAARDTAELIRSEGGYCEPCQTDVSNEHQVQTMITTCIEHYGRIDVLHNNVGILSRGGPVEVALEDWNRCMSINLTSMFLTCKYSLPQMLEQGAGAIINISSIAGQRWLGVPHTAYATSKGAILSFTRNLALEYANKGIRANCVVPGLLDTPMIREPLKNQSPEAAEQILATRNDAVPTGAMGSPWDVAWASLFLASDEARYITGTELVVDGGLVQSAMRAPALGG